MAVNTPQKNEKIETFIELLKSGKINTNHTVTVSDDWGTSKVSLLQLVLNTDIGVDDKLRYLQIFIDLGCGVDDQISGWTPLEMACAGTATTQDFKPLVGLMLKYHKIGDLSDLNILKTAAKSLDIHMFTFVIRSKKIDVNYIHRDTHILHYLAVDHSYGLAIRNIIDLVPELEMNAINRHGLSPLAIAVNNGHVGCIEALKQRDDAKIIGSITNPEIVVIKEIVARYDGNFFADFPEMIEFAISINKVSMLPPMLSDIFIF